MSESCRHIDVEGYSIEQHDRDSRVLIITFSPAIEGRPMDPRSNVAWGRDLVASRGYSAMHIKTNLNCWYRRPQLLDALKNLHEEGVFSGYQKIIMYGGSMGGYAALAYSDICCATHCLSLNPQVWLGPEVRGWEHRFLVADHQVWNRAHLDVNESIASVKKIVTIHDPRCRGDAKHIAMIQHPSMLQLHLPFVGHKIPVHLHNLGMLTWVFDAVVEDRLDPMEFYRRTRARRSLDVWRTAMVERVGPSTCRRHILINHNI